MKVKNSWWKWCSYPRHSALWCKLPHCPSDLGAANCSDTHGKLPATAAQTLAAGSETEREMSHLQMVWMMLRCTGLLEGTVCYLQTCALVWERGAEKGGDNAHDGLSNVALQNGVSVLTVTRVIADLQEAMLNVWTSRPYSECICECLVLPCRCPPGNHQKVSTCDCWCRSPSPQPPYPHSSDSGSSHRPSSPTCEALYSYNKTLHTNGFYKFIKKKHFWALFPWRTPLVCSPREWPHVQYHRGGAGSCIWSQCRRSSLQCTQPAVPLSEYDTCKSQWNQI